MLKILKNQLFKLYNLKKAKPIYCSFHLKEPVICPWKVTALQIKDREW